MDGAVRPVYQDGRGQFVMEDGERLDGVWIWPEEKGADVERTWRAFRLTAIEGHVPADVAANLEVSPTAVRMAKSRVLHRLKEQVGELIQ